jgi:hypothetical protein
MSIKSLIKLVAVIVASMSLGCQESLNSYLNGQEKTEDVIIINSKKLECVKNLPVDLKSFFNGAVAESWDGTWADGIDCIDGALEHFSAFTKGANSSYYSPTELKSFFSEYLVKDHQISEPMVKVLMKFKETLIGGDVHTITKNEIVIARQVLQRLKKSLQLLRPHLKTLMLENPVATQTDIDKAVEQLAASLNYIWPMNARVRSTVEMEDIRVFLRELNIFISKDMSAFNTQSWEQWVPAVQSVRDLVVGPMGMFESTKEWEAAQSASLEVYRLFLTYKLILSNVSIIDPDFANDWDDFFGRALSVVEKTLLFNSSRRLSFVAIDSVIDDLESLSILKLPFSSKTLKTLYKMAVANLLDPRKGAEQSAILGLEEIHVAVLKREVRLHSAIQSFLSTLPLEKITHEDLLARLAKYSVDRKLSKYSDLNIYDREEIKKSWKKFFELVSSSKALIWVNSELQIRAANSAVTRNSLGTQGLLYIGSRFLHWGYASKIESPTTSLISVDAMRKAYNDIYPIGLEFGAVDPRSVDPALRSLHESNLFTLIGNGDLTMNIGETFEWAQMVFSGGVGLTNKLSSGLQESKCFRNERDMFGHPKIDEGCFIYFVEKKIESLTTGLPNFRAAIKTWSQPQKLQLAQSLILASRNEPRGAGYVELSELRVMSMMLYYTEALFAKYDANLNGSLDSTEVDQALPRFSNLLRELSPLKYDFVVKDLFMYLVFVGERPTASGYLKFKWRINTGGLPEAQRYDIVRVFGALKSEVVKPK